MLYAAHALLENGAETYRAEETARRLGVALGVGDAQVFAFPTGVFVSIEQPPGADGAPITGVRRIRKRSVNLSRVNDVNNLARAVAGGGVTPHVAIETLSTLLTPGQPRKMIKPVAACALAAGFFALFFGGGALDFLVAALCGGCVQAFASAFGREDYFHFILSLFGGAFIALVALSFITLTGSGSASAIIAGAIMPLLPGLAMTNAIRDTMRGDLVSGVARGAEALLVAVALACGAGVVTWLFQLVTTV